MTTTTEPRITLSNRTIKVAYLLGADNDGTRGGERRHYAVLSIGYNKGGMNYFSGRMVPRSYSSSISRQTEEDAVGPNGEKWGTSTSFMLFDGLGLLRSDEVKRYSEKALREFAETARAHFETVRDDPQVAKFFDVAEAVG
jgi:hypothetical protein